MNFTKNQQNAIDSRDCSLIISAGAGSGKTAVLTERILERVCDENDTCNINDFLIVTFTKAAAKELSDRIRKKLSERAAKDTGNKKIVRNIALMPLAKIMTINAFCYEIVRENFQKLGLPATVRIADEAEISVIRNKIMNEVVDEYFEEKGDDTAFLSAYEIFSSSKNDGGFIDTLLSLDLKLSNVTDREGFCRYVAEGYREICSSSEFFDTDFGKKVKNHIKTMADETANTLEKLMQSCSGYDVLIEKYYPVIEHEFEFARAIYHACDKGYDSVRSEVSSHKVATFAGKIIPKSFENPALKDAVSSSKKAVADVFYDEVSRLCACSDELLKLAAEDTYNVISKLFELVDEFEKRLSARKKELSLLEFSDAERYTLSLLVKEFSPFTVTDFAKSLRERYKEIYIDEYQDVNPLQDAIFKAISKQKDGGECNRFMVGDIKQSIYRFRGARSEIFMSYRDSFSDIDTDANAKRIFMSDNFRCSRAVIGLTNLLFERLMGVYYGEGDRLCFARHEELDISEKVKMIAFEYNSDIADGVSSPEIEAAIIAGEIRKIVNNPDYTDSNGRMYKYSDVGILARNKASLKVFESVFNALGIPAFCSFGESFYGKKEIILCLDILNAIDNPERDIYLAGFMRSFAGGFSDDELALIKHKHRDMSLYRSVVNYSLCENGEDEALSVKCREFVDNLRFYRTYSRGKSADKLLWKLYCDMDILNMCSSEFFTGDKKGTRKNLLKLYQMARDFSKTSFHGVGAFIEYINGSMENSDVKAERELLSDGVSLMTIHSSKGLEFPVCFVSSLAKQFDKRDEKERLVFSESSGIAVKLCDTKGIKSTESEGGLVSIDTPYRRFIASCLDGELMDEEIRILYVALTRARDRLILTSAFPKKIANAMKDIASAGFTGKYSTLNNYFSIIMSALANESVLFPYFSAAGMSFDASSFDAEAFLDCTFIDAENAKQIYDGMTEADIYEEETEDFTGTNKELLDVLLKKRNFKVEVSDLPSKITVSMLKKGLIDEENLVSDEKKVCEEETYPLFVTGEKAADGAEKGTAMHMFMQFCDFENCEADCEKEADRLFENGFIDKRQREILEIQRLKDFFATDFYKNIKNSRKIYREQRFNLAANAFDGNMAEDILVQGVIDLFYENDDGTYTVVDFKTDRVFGEGAEETLIDRHKEQLMYYKKAAEDMTEREVKHCFIYSFSLMKEIEV